MGRQLPYSETYYTEQYREKRTSMKPKYIALMIIIILLAAAGVFIYERTQVSIHADENGNSVAIIGGADGPTSVFIAGKIGGEDTMAYKQFSMEEAKQILRNAGEAFFCESSRESIRISRVCTRRMEKILVLKREELRRKCRVYLPAGMLLGVMIIILLL